MPHVPAARPLRRRARGFTLIELLAVLGILAILVVMSFPLAELSARREQERDLKQGLWEIRDAIDAYKRMADAGLIAGAPRSGYPPDLRTLVDGVDVTGGTHVYLLRRLPRDPFAAPDANGGWGLRSYASPGDNPQPGDDVFDVYSTSTSVGLNGVPLRQW